MNIKSSQTLVQEALKVVKTITPEEALEKTNNKFITRFSWMEKKIISDGKSINKMTLEEMDKYWERSKKT